MRSLKEKYINPYTDFGFKKLFGTEFNKDILIDFLNELLRKDEGTITDITYLSNEHVGRSKEDRRAIFDIYCKNEKGEHFLVEMQRAKQNYFKDRSIYYSTFPVQEQAQAGTWNFKLKAVYTIGILDFIFDEDKEDSDVYHHEVQLFDKMTQKFFYDKLTYIYLEMPKFKKKEANLKTHFDKWLYVLKNLETLHDRPKKLREKVFQKLFKQAEIAKYSEEEYRDYEDSLKQYRDLKNTIDTAKEDGRVEGREEGIKEGIEQEKFNTAKKMLTKGYPKEDIAEMTGLSIEEIEKI